MLMRFNLTVEGGIKMLLKIDGQRSRTVEKDIKKSLVIERALRVQGVLWATLIFLVPNVFAYLGNSGRSFAAPVC